MDLAGKIEFLKFAYAEEAELIQIDSFDATGIWFHNKGALQRMLGTERPASLVDYPTIFVPLAQIEWLLANDKDRHEATSAPQAK